MTLLPENPAETAYEAELIQRIKSGEHDLFYRLIQPYESRVYAAALAIVRNEADAEDIAQDSILKALRHCRSFAARPSSAPGFFRSPSTRRA